MADVRELGPVTIEAGMAFQPILVIADDQESCTRAMKEVGQALGCAVMGRVLGRPVAQVEHINGNPSDNRRENLREIPPAPVPPGPSNEQAFEPRPDDR